MTKICLFGLPSTGKTTYLIALGTHYGAKCADRERLPALAGIVRNGGFLEATKAAVTYRIDIEKRGFRHQQYPIEICDTPGEIFDNLAMTNTRYHNEQILKLLDRGGGCLIFLSDYTSNMDEYNESIFKTFTGLLPNRNIPLAIAATKVERGEFWLSRHEPETDLFENLYPRTTAFLRRRIPVKNLRFFALSNFGVLGQHDPRPNKVVKLNLGKPVEVLRDFGCWQPYNLLSPLQWLACRLEG